MEPFEQRGIDVDGVLRAVVLGGNVLGVSEGKKNTRRRVPKKQERLVRLVGDKGRVDFDELVTEFEAEWESAQRRRKGKPLRRAKRDFFRNLADVAARVNGALVAGYRDEGARQVVLKAIGGSYVGFHFDHQAYAIWWSESDDFEDLASDLRLTTGSQHVPLVAAPEEPQSLEEEPRSETAEASYPPEVVSDAQVEETPAEIVEPDVRPPSPGGEPLEITVNEDPVTGLWSFELLGHRIEVQRRHGFVNIDGQVRKAEVVKGLSDIQELAGGPLDHIRRLIRSFEEAQSLRDGGTGETQL